MYKVQASKTSGYRFGLSRNISIFNLIQYLCTNTVSYILNFYILYSILTLYNPLQHPPLWSPS